MLCPGTFRRQISPLVGDPRTQYGMVIKTKAGIRYVTRVEHVE
jgi:hypothetical protein